MSLSASRARTVFRACVVNAVRDSEALMEALVTGTREALTAQESSTRDLHKRTQISDALRLLKQHEASLPKAYPMALLEIFAEGPSAAKTRAGQPGGMDLGELALMDDADVLVQVELSRAQQIAALATEATLAELNTLVSSAQGLHSVQPESNPFRPENYIRALQQVVSDTGVSGEVRQLWMSQMRELLGMQLVSAYKRAAQSLREHGVEPVGYAVAGAPGVRSGHGGGYAHSSQMGVGYAPPSAYGAPASEYGAASAYGQGYGAGWGGASGNVALAPQAEEALLTVGILRQMLAGGGDPFAYDARGGYTAATPANAYVTPAAVEAMEDIAQLERIVGRLSGGAAVPVTGWNGTSAHAPVAASPTRTAHEVVSRMMDNIAQDSRLLPPMQRAVQSLEPALKELVQHDTRFFTDEQHPARRLLDELTQRSLAFNAEDGPAFSRFMRLVNEAVGHLASIEIRDAAPFAQVLKALEKAWTAQERRQLERHEAQQRELLQREQRELLAEKIAADFRRLPDADKVPADLLAFVTGPWADVVAQAQSSQPQETGGDPGGYLALVPLLLCCAQPEQLRSDPERLGQAIADMVPVLVRGLESIDHPIERIAEVTQRLAQLQGEALNYAAASVFDDTPAEEVSPETRADDVLSSDTAAAADPSMAGAVAQPALRIGQWVEIITNQRAVRTQLTWCSPHNTLFLFTGADASTQSMTRRMIDKLSSDGAFRLISDQPVVDRALRAVRTKPAKLR